MNEMYEIPGVAQMVEREWKKWLLLARQRSGESAKLLPTITISREKGSGGSSIARTVAKRLGFVVFDREIVDEVARSASVDRLVVEYLDERSRHSIRERFEHILLRHAFSPETYMAHLAKTIVTIGEKGHAVIIGRGASLLLPAKRCLRARVVAPLEIRTERLMASLGLESSAAEAIIRETDRERARFIHEHFQQSDADPLLYDLVINTAGITIDTAAGLIVQAVRARFPDVTDSSATPRAAVLRQ